MTWTKLTDDFLEDTTIMDLHDRSYRLFVSSLVYCSRNLTDGVLTPKAIRVLEAILGYKAKRYAAEIVAAGLWVTDGDGYRVRNYLKYNRAATKVKEEREKARQRMANVRSSVESSLERSAEQKGEHNPERSPARSPSPTRPDLAPLLRLESPLQDAPPNGHGQELWRRLLVATRVRTEPDAKKLTRVIASRRSTESDIVAAIEAAEGPGVRDRLAVALSELTKRGRAA